MTRARSRNTTDRANDKDDPSKIQRRGKKCKCVSAGAKKERLKPPCVSAIIDIATRRACFAFDSSVVPIEVAKKQMLQQFY